MNAVEGEWSGTVACAGGMTPGATLPGMIGADSWEMDVVIKGWEICGV